MLTPTIQQRLALVYNRIAAAAKKHDRNANDIILVAVSKGHSHIEIATTIAAGQLVFGESYVQEAIPKIQALKNIPNLTWHYIGPLQSNKTKLVAQNFAWVQSIDREKTAHLLNQHRPAHLPPLNICLEINVSNEESKSGVTPKNLQPLIDAVQKLPNLRLRGLMAIPAPTSDYNQQRSAFHEVHELFKSLQQQGLPLDTLSIGMSDDLEAAIAEGATMVRVGTAIFGERIK